MGKFGLSSVKKAQDLAALYLHTVSKVQELRQAVYNLPPSLQLLHKIDEISNVCSITADAAQAVSELFPSEDWKKVAYHVQDKMFEIYDNLNHDTKIQKSIQDLKSSETWSTLTPSQQLFAHNLLRDLEKEGISSTSSTSLDIQRLQSEFSINIRKYKAEIQADFKEIEGIPSKYRPERQGDIYSPSTSILFSKSQLISSMNMCDKPNLRKKLFTGISSFAPENDKILEKLIETRYKFSKELGYANFSAFTLNYQSFPISPDNLLTKLFNCHEHLKWKLENEYAVLLDKKALEEQISRFNPVSLEPWDIPYYIQRILENQLTEKFPKYTSFHAAKNYFTVYNVLEGISSLLKVIFRVTIKIDMCPSEEAWSNDLIKLNFFDDGHEEIGVLYLDLFERKGKSQIPAAKFNIVCARGCSEKEGFQKPVAVLSCNFAKNEEIAHSIRMSIGDIKREGLSFAMLQEFYHEFGHALHSIFSQGEFQTYSGTRVPLDLGEIPSHVFEHFITDYEFVKTWAIHKDSKQPISHDLFNHYSSEIVQFPAFSHHIQLSLAIFDQLIHTENSLTNAVKAFEKNLEYRELQGKWYCSIEHFVDYASSYYSYVLDKSLSNVVWETIFQKDAFNEKAGQIIKEHLLKPGGNVPPQQQINNIFKPFLILDEKNPQQDVDPFYVMEYWYKNYFHNTQLISIEKMRAEKK